MLLLSLTVRWLLGWLLGGRLPTLDDTAGGTPRVASPADISIVIPARNEAHSLPGLLRSLNEQTIAAVEVIVVDDHSTDDTAGAAARGGAIVIQSATLPAGWLGKPWACAQGAAAATGHILVFLDADTTAGPRFVAMMQRALGESRGLVSVAPYHQTQRAYEMASALFNLVSMMGVGALSMWRGARVTGAFGPCLAIRATDYAAIGGHEAVRHEVVDDVALARICRRHDMPVKNLAGTSYLRYRMYPHGAAQLIEGWSKNFAAGAAATPPLRLLAIAAWISGLIETGAVTIAGVITLLLEGAAPSWPHVVFYGLFAVQLWWMLRRIGNHHAIAWLHPIAAFAFVAICARSVLLQWRGEATWKGRRVATARQRPS